MRRNKSKLWKEGPECCTENSRKMAVAQCSAVGGSSEDVPGVLQCLVKYDIFQPEQSLLHFFAPQGNRQMSVKAFVDEPQPQRALTPRLACMCVLETGHTPSSKRSTLSVQITPERVSTLAGLPECVRKRMWLSLVGEAGLWLLCWAGTKQSAEVHFDHH